VAIFLLIIRIAVALGIIGVVVKGLVFLLVIGIIIFLASLVIFGSGDVDTDHSAESPAAARTGP
jgi:hypothetical protein